MVPFFFVHRTLHFSFFFGILPDWGAGGLPSCISITRTLRPVNSSLSFIPSQSFQTFLSSSDDVRSLGDIFLRRSVREWQSTPRTGQEDNRGTGSTKRAQGPGAARPQSHRGRGQILCPRKTMHCLDFGSHRIAWKLFYSPVNCV